jgi:hypothetical protein
MYPSQAHLEPNYIFTTESLGLCIRYNPGITYNTLTSNFTPGSGEHWVKFRDSMSELITNKFVMTLLYDDWDLPHREIHYFWMKDSQVLLRSGPMDQIHDDG